MNVRSTLSRSGLKLKKHAPSILVYGGVSGVIAASGMLISATLEAKPYINAFKQDLNDLEIKRQEFDHEEYPFKDFNKDVTACVGEYFPKIAKIYVLPVTTMALSLGGILAGFNILKKRHVAVMGAYSALDASYKAYRKRVSEKLGEKVERDVFHSVEELKDEKDPDKTKKVIRSEEISDYAKWFDENSIYFENDPSINLHFIRLIEKSMNDKLQLDGHVFLNEVYDALGLPHTSAGAVVGWVLDSGVGDGFIDFGVYDENYEHARDFVNGYEKRILLDFNVDGLIWDLI